MSARVHRPDGFFVVRVPALPFDVFLALSSGDARLDASVAKRPDGDGEADRAHDRAREAATERLKTLASSDGVRAAIAFASPTLARELGRWLSSPHEQASPALLRSVTKYTQRMATRATPFGLFSAIGFGLVGEATRLSLAEETKWRGYVRPDPSWCIEAWSRFSSKLPLSDATRVKVVDSLVTTPRFAMFTIFEPERDGRRELKRHAIERSEYLDVAVAGAVAGPIAIGALAEQIREHDPEVTIDEARAFVLDLVGAGLLAREDWSLAITGKEPFASLVESVAAGRPAEVESVGKFDEARARTGGRERYDLGDSQAPWHRDRDRAADAAGASSIKLAIDTTLEEHAISISTDLVARVLEGARLLARVSVPGREGSVLDTFRDRFVEKFGARAVPLLEACDGDLGVGFPAEGTRTGRTPAWIANLPSARSRPSSVELDRADLHLLRRVDALDAGASLELDDDDLRVLDTRGSARLPPSFIAFVRPLEEHGRVLRLVSAEGPSGAHYLARFCHALPGLTELVRTHVAREEALDPGAVFAEIVHTPGIRVAATVTRPCLRTHEITYLGESGLPADARLPATDLWLRVAGGMLELWSERLGRRVVPRYASALRYDHGPAPYRLLAEMSGRTFLRWDWRGLHFRKFLPRVTKGAFVLADARWSLPRGDLAPICRASGRARMREVALLRDRLALPRHVAVVDGDLSLVVDLEQPVMVDALAHLAEAEGSLVVTETPTLNDMPIQAHDGRRAAELLVPFTEERTARADDHATTAEARPAFLRAAIASPALQPGDGWLYLKVYPSPMAGEAVLLDLLAPLARRLEDERAIVRWFYIRYWDPDPHVRLRLRGAPEVLRARVLPAILAELDGAHAEGLVARTQIDTYEPEVIRYGGPAALDACEELFAHDSAAVIDALRELREHASGPTGLGLACAMGIDALLEDFRLDVEARLSLATEIRNAYRDELATTDEAVHEIARRYRQSARALSDLLSPTPSDERGRRLRELWRARGAASIARRAELRDLDKRGELVEPLRSVIASLLHMHANRMFETASRRQEHMTFEYLVRAYESRVARSRKKSPK